MKNSGKFVLNQDEIDMKKKVDDYDLAQKEIVDKKMKEF